MNINNIIAIKNFATNRNIWQSLKPASILLKLQNNNYS